VPTSSTPQLLSDRIRRDLALFGKVAKVARISAK